MKLNINPVLISQQLDQYYKQEDVSPPTYIVLAAWDTTGHLSSHKNDFFNSLEDKYTYDSTREEVTFPSGVVLNVHNALHTEEVVPVDAARLLRGKRAAQLSTYYLFWVDPGYNLREAESEDFLGPHTIQGTRAALLRPSNTSFFCEMNLKGHEHNVWFVQKTQ